MSLKIKSSKKTLSERKGIVINKVSSSIQSRIDVLSTDHGGVSELRRYENGSIGAFFNDGKFRFIAGSTTLQPKTNSKLVSRPTISPRSSSLAINKYYTKKKNYKNQNLRNEVLVSSKHKRNAPKVNKMSSDVDHVEKTVDNAITKKELNKLINSRQEGGDNTTTEHKVSQEGGANDIKLKEAVQLLRQYYTEKFENDD